MKALVEKFPNLDPVQDGLKDVELPYSLAGSTDNQSVGYQSSLPARHPFAHNDPSAGFYWAPQPAAYSSWPPQQPNCFNGFPDTSSGHSWAPQPVAYTSWPPQQPNHPAGFCDPSAGLSWAPPTTTCLSSNPSVSPLMQPHPPNRPAGFPDTSAGLSCQSWVPPTATYPASKRCFAASPTAVSDDSGCLSASSTPSPPQPEKETTVAIAAKALLRAPEGKLVVGDIYRFFESHNPCFKKALKDWRSTVRHHLSTSPCFVRREKSAGRGFFWAIHPAYLERFRRGVFTTKVECVMADKQKKRKKNAMQQLQPTVE